MKISLKLGDTDVATAASYMNGELLTFSETGASSRRIGMLTDEVAEIARNTLFIVGEDNSLAEMMAASHKGASAVLCTKAPASLEKIPELPVIVCEDTRAALERFAASYTAQSRHKTVLLAGGHGNTQTCAMIGAVLEERYAVHKAAGVRPDAEGKAELLLDLPAGMDFHVAQVNIQTKKDAGHFGNLFACDLLILDEDKVACENAVNGDLLPALAAGGAVVCDAAVAPSIPAQISRITFSDEDPTASVYAKNVREDSEKTVFDIVYAGGCITDVRIWLTGKEALRSALAAAAVGLHCGVPTERIRTGLNNDHDLASAVEIRTLGGVTVIVGSTSATEESMRRGIDTLCAIAKRNGNARKIALLGDIRDFGQNTSGLHMQMGAYVAQKQIDLLFTFGVAAEQIGEGAKRAGMDPNTVVGNMELFAPQKSAEAVRRVLRPGDVLLVRIARQSAVTEIVHSLEETLK